MQCKRCLQTPGFHSFERIADVSGNQYFYCFPAHNKQSVQTHEDMMNFVSHFPTTGSWSLIFHARGYGFQHMMPLSIALEMARLVQQNHSRTLQKIYIVQGHWFMQFLLNCIFPFMKKEMREKFVLVKGSLLEVMTFFREQGIRLQELEPLRNRFA
jgi:hypothetical protein